MSATPIPDDHIKSGKQLAQVASDLHEGEIEELLKVHVSLQQKYGPRPNTASNLEAMRDEYVTRLASIGILATVDPTPCFYGEPPVVEILGKVAGDAIFTDGFDHERKQYEVRKSVERGEDYLGQKEPANKRK